MIRRIILLLLFISISQSQWQEINQPDIGTVSIILADGNQLFTATNQAQVYTSNDQADSWEMLADTMDTQPYGADLLLVKGDAVFFTQNIGDGPYNYICLSGFAGWGPWQELAHQSSALISMVDNDSLIFTLLNGISISSDVGETWTEIPEPPITSYIRLNLATNDYLYVSHGCQICRTADLGQTWEDITGILDDVGFASPYSCSTVLAMARHEDQLIISMYWGGGKGKLFVSDDYGTSWTVLNEFPVDHSVNAIASKNNVLYVGTGSTLSGVYYTTDLTTWIDFSTGLESYDYSVSQLVATDEYLYKTGGTINSYQILLPELDTHWERAQFAEFALSQNYPNPFNPTTTLKYDLPEDAMVNITIYDMMGRVVKTMVNTQQNAGYKSIQWNATNNAGQQISAGLYLYTIEAGDFRQTKKMILLK
jgi:hypothetical protein